MDRGPRTAWSPRRILVPAGLAVLAYVAISVGPLWLDALISRAVRKRLLVQMLLAAWSAYAILLIALPVVSTALAIATWRARRRGARRPWLARGLALCLALLLGLAMAEGVAAFWLARMETHAPPLPTRFADTPAGAPDVIARGAGPADPTARLPEDDALDVVILGESSAYGCPYDPWFSVARIVVWKLGEAIPGHRFREVNLALPGIRLDIVQERLGLLKRRPDLVILYAGHNEFDARYHCQRTPRYYLDDRAADGAEPAVPGRGFSPLSRLIEQTLENRKVALPPRSYDLRPLVDVPAFTAAEYAERLDDFRRRLEAITSYLEGLGARMVLVPPPANDADFEPNRSYLTPETPRAERDRFAREFQAVRRAEQADPMASIDAYRKLLGRQPGFAEAHYRLARLLEAAGRPAEADRHYVAARDRDGYPARCLSDFLHAYHELAANHPHAILVDAPALLRKRTARGLLGDEFIADAHHPSIAGYAAIAQSILRELHARRTFDWPESSPAPVVTPAGCAAHFGMDAQKWISVCETLHGFYTLCGPLRPDPSQRYDRARRYLEAIPQLRNGRDPGSLRLPGIGIGSGSASLHTAAVPPGPG